LRFIQIKDDVEIGGGEPEIIFLFRKMNLLIVKMQVIPLMGITPNQQDQNFVKRDCFWRKIMKIDVSERKHLKDRSILMWINVLSVVYSCFVYFFLKFTILYYIIMNFFINITFII